MNKIKLKGERITDAGLIVDVESEIKTKFNGKVVKLFFPVHVKSWGEYQVSEDRQEFLKEVIIGQSVSVWKTGTRAGFEVGSNRKVI